MSPMASDVVKSSRWGGVQPGSAGFGTAIQHILVIMIHRYGDGEPGTVPAKVYPLTGGPVIEIYGRNLISPDARMG